MVHVLPRRTFRDADSDRIIDLVVFYRHLYEYWYHRGKWRAVLNRLVDFTNCVVLSILVFVFGLMFDWESALNCEGSDCARVQLIHSPTWPKNHKIAAFIFFAASVCAAAWELRRVVEGVWLHGEVHAYVQHVISVGYETPFHEYIRKFRTWRMTRGGHQELEDPDVDITGKQLPSLDDISWPDFLEIVCEVLRKDKGIVNRTKIDELRVVQTMMLIENFHIALHHHGILNRVPLCFASDDFITFLIGSMMEGYRVRSGEQAEKHLKEQLFLYTLLYMLTYPFIVSFHFLKLLVKNVAAVRTKPENFFKRSWSTTATWKMRLYNEVPHIAAARLYKGSDVADRIIHKAGAARENPILRVLERSSGSIIFLIVVASTINTALLNYGTVFDRTLVWWLSTALLVFGMSSRESQVVDREYNHESDLEELVCHTHYEQPAWRVSPSAFCKSISVELFPHRLWTITVAFFSVIFMPLVMLWIYKSDALTYFILFMKDHHRTVDGIGSLCTPSTFMIRHAGSTDSLAEGTEDSDREHMVQIRSEASTEDLQLSGRTGFNGGESYEWKVEKSIVSFAAVYPNWEEHYSKRNNDDLGVNALLNEIDGKLTESQLNMASGLPSSRPPPRTLEESIRPDPDDISTRQLTTHLREARNVGMIDALHRSTWNAFQATPRPGATSSSGDLKKQQQPPRTGGASGAGSGYGSLSAKDEI